MRKLVIAIVAAATAAVTTPAMAQTIHQGEHRQEQRIRQGERTGQLTPAEARRLQQREMRLHRTEARMRWRNGGTLRPHQRQRLRRMERRDSRAIYRNKHNYRRD